MISKLYKYINNKFGKSDNVFWNLLRYICLGLASVLIYSLCIIMIIMIIVVIIVTMMISKWMLVTVAVVFLIVLIGRITFILYGNDPK